MEMMKLHEVLAAQYLCPKIIQSNSQGSNDGLVVGVL